MASGLGSVCRKLEGGESDDDSLTGDFSIVDVPATTVDEPDRRSPASEEHFDDGSRDASDSSSGGGGGSGSGNGFAYAGCSAASASLQMGSPTSYAKPTTGVWHLNANGRPAGVHMAGEHCLGPPGKSMRREQPHTTTSGRWTVLAAGAKRSSWRKLIRERGKQRDKARRVGVVPERPVGRGPQLVEALHVGQQLGRDHLEVGDAAAQRGRQTVHDAVRQPERAHMGWIDCVDHAVRVADLDEAL